MSSFWQEKLIIKLLAKYGPLERERNLVKASLTDFFKVAAYDPYNSQCKSSSVSFFVMSKNCPKLLITNYDGGRQKVSHCVSTSMD